MKTLLIALFLFVAVPAFAQTTDIPYGSTVRVEFTDPNPAGIATAYRVDVDFVQHGTDYATTARNPQGLVTLTAAPFTQAAGNHTLGVVIVAGTAVSARASVPITLVLGAPQNFRIVG